MIDDLLNKLESKEKAFLSQNIFSPFVKGGSNVVVKIDGVTYKFKTKQFKKDGFAVFKAKDHSNVRMVRAAKDFEVIEYLELLPKVDFILVGKPDRWLAIPFNQESFSSRFGAISMSSVMLVDNAEVLDTVTARFDGNNFWFDSVKFTQSSDKLMEFRDRINEGNYTVSKDMTKGLTPEEKQAISFAAAFHKEASMSDFEKRLGHEFGQVNASVENFVERGDLVEVRWLDSTTNAKYTSVLKKDSLDVVTAGICLSGGDKLFDLQSLVTVTRQGRNRGHVVHVGNGGMDEAGYWDMYGDNS